MSIATSGRLYELLPAIYRIKDAEHEQSLRALFAILESEVDALEADIQGLYDNWFIETCDEWVVPYIGDLLEVPTLQTGGIGGFTLRSYVANVLAYRRRKGTASVLEQMAHDVSGWPTRAVEFQKSLAATQHLNHIRSQIPAIADLRNANQLGLLGTAFQSAKYSCEVRSIQGGRGKYNIPNIGLFVWRLQSYVLNRVQPVKAAKPDDPHATYDNRFTFNPSGIDQPLFIRPQTEIEISHLAEEQNVPGPLRRRPLYDELQARREALRNGEAPNEIYFGDQPVFSIYLDKASTPLLPEAIAICDLSDWHEGLTPVAEGITVQVDPRLGRLAFPDAIPPEQVDVSYAYGFSGDIGGGPYNRSDSLQDLFNDRDRIWWAGVSKMHGELSGDFTSIGDAIEAWNTLDAGAPDTGVIAILDSYSYEEDFTGTPGKIILKDGKKLLIIGAEWLSGRKPGENDWSSELGLNRFLTANRVRPHIKGNISVQGKADSEFYINGVLLEGELKALAGDLVRMDLSHCTVVPRSGGIQVTNNSNTRLDVQLSNSVCGAIILRETINSLSITDSIIDGVVGTNLTAKAIAGNTGNDTQEFAPPTTIERSTVFGTVHVKELVLASETIFTQPVTVKRLQAGCVRFSYVPPGSTVPRRFRCQPDLALEERLRELRDETNNPGLTMPENEQKRIELWMKPEFSSEDYGDPDYAQLSMGCPVCPKGISTGAEDGSEMGVFNYLKQPQREANIRTNLNEYLRFGMNAEIFYVNYKEVTTGYA